jgi:hypothetical protein
MKFGEDGRMQVTVDGVPGTRPCIVELGIFNRREAAHLSLFSAVRPMTSDRERTFATVGGEVHIVTTGL